MVRVLTKEEREAKKLQARERREKRNERKVQKQAEAESTSTSKSSNASSNVINGTNNDKNENKNNENERKIVEKKRSLTGFLSLDCIPEDDLVSILCFLPARDLGAVIMTCKYINQVLKDGREQHLLCRLQPRFGMNEAAIRELLRRGSLENSQQNRLMSKKVKKGLVGADDYPGYVRFVEETVCGFVHQNYGIGSLKQMMPAYAEGRVVSASPEHSLCRTGGDKRAGPGGSGCAAWGIGKRGQLGNGNRNDMSKPSPIVGGIGSKIRIVQVSAGGGLVRVAHSLLLTDLGQVLSFGTAMYGQLGHGYSSGKTLRDVYRPQYIEALRRVRCTYVSAGELDSAAVTEDGDLYTWGDNFCGQLGIGNKRPKVEPQQVISGGLEDECVEVVSCGFRHTIAVTEDGECFTFGLGHYGALGRSYTPFQYTVNIEGEEVTGLIPDGPPPENIPPSQHIEEVEHEDGITAEMRAHLHMLGNLTLDDPSDQCVPVKVVALDGIQIVGASTGHRHSIVLDNEGGVYTFGCGRNGKLGHGDMVKQDYPLKVLELVDLGVAIAQVSAGVDSSMALSTYGQVYSWGKATNGRIGHNYSGNILIPRMVGLSTKAVSIECAYVHSLIVGIDGSVYECGGVGIDGNEDGQQEIGLDGSPVMIPSFKVWQRTPEPKEEVKKNKWKKYGKYELKGRSQALAEEVSGWNA